MINLLPQIGEYVTEDTENGETEIRNKDVDFMGLIAESDELEIFECESV